MLANVIHRVACYAAVATTSICIAYAFHLLGVDRLIG